MAAVSQRCEMRLFLSASDLSEAVIVKLTPNITDIRHPARAAHAGNADAVSLINTINSITSVNLDEMSPEPMIGGKGTHGGYCGQAVKPIATSV